jgi:hypothetical protein
VAGTKKVREVAPNRHAGPRPPDSNRGASGEGLVAAPRRLHGLQPGGRREVNVPVIVLRTEKN